MWTLPAIGNTIPLQFNLRTARRSLGSWEFFSIHPCQSMGYCGRHGGRGTASESIFVQKSYNGSGYGAFLALVAVPRINKLRVVNTLNSSTPAAPTIIYFVISTL